MPADPEVTGPPTGWHPDRAVPALIWAAAQRHGHRTAVVGADATLSYAELRHAVAGLADVLRRHGATAAPVAVLAHRGAAQLVACLAALHAGAGYACVDANQPRARVESQLRGCGAAVVVTDRDDPPVSGQVVLAVDLAGWIGAGAAAERAGALGGSPPVAGDQLAYTVFTSGSTGVPKVVEIPHAALANYAAFVARLVDPERADGERLRFASVTSLATDLGHTAVFPALTGGDTVHLVPTETATDPDDFADYQDEHRVDVLKITPSHLAALLDEAAERALPRRLLIVGGEVCRWELVDQVRELSDVRMVNHYGPTETTVGALTFEVPTDPAARPGTATVPIGRPIDNARVAVVDADLRPVAAGVEGELLIFGAGLARGYRDDPATTGEMFPTDHPEGRCYRTGDLVTRHSDGLVEFHGRRDGQVKIRGHRVELGEVEQAVRRCAGVRRAAVVPVAGTGSVPRLVAYVVPSEPPGPTARELRDQLRETLPDYLLPGAVVCLDELPRTPSGKLDVRALPAPGRPAARR
ncbi:amino acid adenylation domain-containing protein [Micromonospora sp. AMSO12t]|uniref:amino acid adenylation domain-containing protein n=1 Tax=Micromonospora sp. AMSO12t TaxID=2650410 RepID=UPI001788A425|nr:amino acid adenylation domain-containing protein [Micromonospora sp. AMSO12t]